MDPSRGVVFSNIVNQAVLSQNWIGAKVSDADAFEEGRAA